MFIYYYKPKKWRLIGYLVWMLLCVWGVFSNGSFNADRVMLLPGALYFCYKMFSELVSLLQPPEKRNILFEFNESEFFNNTPYYHLFDGIYRVPWSSVIAIRRSSKKKYLRNNNNYYCIHGWLFVTKENILWGGLRFVFSR
jgi:hypothetical protein